MGDSARSGSRDGGGRQADNAGFDFNQLNLDEARYDDDHRYDADYYEDEDASNTRKGQGPGTSAARAMAWRSSRSNSATASSTTKAINRIFNRRSSLSINTSSLGSRRPSSDRSGSTGSSSSSIFSGVGNKLKSTFASSSSSKDGSGSGSPGGIRERGASMLRSMSNPSPTRTMSMPWKKKEGGGNIGSSRETEGRRASQGVEDVDRAARDRQNYRDEFDDLDDHSEVDEDDGEFDTSRSDRRRFRSHSNPFNSPSNFATSPDHMKPLPSIRFPSTFVASTASHHPNRRLSSAASDSSSDRSRPASPNAPRLRVQFLEDKESYADPNRHERERERAIDRHHRGRTDSGSESMARGIGIGIAMFDYLSNEPNDLSFKKGTTVTIISNEDEEWWVGEVRAGGKRGMFPRCYVKVHLN